MQKVLTEMVPRQIFEMTLSEWARMDPRRRPVVPKICLDNLCISRLLAWDDKHGKIFSDPPFHRCSDTKWVNESGLQIISIQEPDYLRASFNTPEGYDT